MSSAGGSQRRGASPGPVVRAARGCSTSSASNAIAFRTPLTVSASTPATSSHGAVTRRARSEAETAHARTGAEDMRLRASALTATAAHNCARSAGRAPQPATTERHIRSDAAHPADVAALLAVSASHPARVQVTADRLRLDVTRSPISLLAPTTRADVCISRASGQVMQGRSRRGVAAPRESARTPQRAAPGAARCARRRGERALLLTGHLPPISAQAPRPIGATSHPSASPIATGLRPTSFSATNRTDSLSRGERATATYLRRGNRP